ncbi:MULTISPECIES: sigma-70 family RNA polymerase sigma factor [unclassified Rathayibacter]|uniref:sigma-70 family RNA polymerase sigma factor n=1 Tax=unclassified Rathayibacter TaxID=2609250 RepID=UPI001FB2048B|nr:MULTISPECIES: sigma-70 family RNA polymerase sigma factor [unclassified Rathayibacter]MCJ1674717.1 sigma-70 family RNA polymerase sigma factor [Rathayibacter sp. VKM Ac-2929]MCJ1685268.1 sigma-70 family RNA polymerase sigma factor [Rathayibacter sp. VKM Ac-2928]
MALAALTMPTTIGPTTTGPRTTGPTTTTRRGDRTAMTQPDPHPAPVPAAGPAAPPLDPTPGDPTPGDPTPLDLTAAFDEHGSALLGFAVNALRDRGLAEDCVQETFLRAWRSRERYVAERASPRTWLFAIARNVIVDAHRSLQRLPRIVPAEVLDDVPGDDVDPLEPLMMVEALARLSPEHRQVIVAIHLRGGSYAEVSAATGVAVATLRTRTFYALKALRTHLAAPDPTPEDRS